MREIKFRAWFQVHKRMVYNLGFNNESFDFEKFSAVWDNDSCDENGLQDATLNYELMQYTGLKDKNGKEIYEGDILKAPSSLNYTVVFDSGVFSGQSNKLMYFSASCFEDTEIIGNIHEVNNAM